MLASLLGAFFKVVGTAALATLVVLFTIYLVIAGFAAQF